jgi:hypothetical protein
VNNGDAHAFALEPEGLGTHEPKDGVFRCGVETGNDDGLP